MSDDIWTRLQTARGNSAEPPPAWRFRFPNTLRTVYQDGKDQRPVFEPALMHFPNAYRAGDPRFPDERLERRWLTARRTALDLVLATVSGSDYADELILRGSVLMSCWYPATAREPGDLDFVVRSDDWEVEDLRTDAFFDEIARAAEQLSADGEGNRDGVRIYASGAFSDDIWTYDRVPGRRLTLPWDAGSGDIPGGWVQLDFVFGEKVHGEIEPAEIALSPGRRAVPLRAASKELSLAWKLVWLLTDMHPQGKDLYDAVLLAEDTPLRYSVLRDAYNEADSYEPDEYIDPEVYRVSRPLALADLTELCVEPGWDHFQGEYPSVEGSADDWKLRLCLALEPTFSLLDGQPASAYELEVAWLAPLIARIAAAAVDHGDELQQLLLRGAVRLPAAVVITRELVGRERMSVSDAVRTVLSTPGRAAAERGRYDQFWALEKAARAYGLELRAPWPEHLADSPVVALVKSAFDRWSADTALEILAPLAADPDPRLSSERALSAVVEKSGRSLARLHCAVQRARTAVMQTH